MKPLKTIALIGASALALSATAAAAQPLTTSYVDGLNWKITNAAREGRISWPQARELRGELSSVQPLAWRVQTGRANHWQRERLMRTVDHIQMAIHNGDRYSYGYGYGYRHDRDWRR